MSQTRKITTGFIIIAIISLAVYFLLKVGVIQNVFNRQEKTGSLVAGYPDFPAFKGAVVEKSSVYRKGGKTYYTALRRVDGGSLHEVTEWYIDDTLPFTWIFDKPLYSISNTKQGVNIHKDNLSVELIFEQNKPGDPVHVQETIIVN